MLSVKTSRVNSEGSSPCIKAEVLGMSTIWIPDIILKMMTNHMREAQAGGHEARPGFPVPMVCCQPVQITWAQRHSSRPPPPPPSLRVGGHSCWGPSSSEIEAALLKQLTQKARQDRVTETQLAPLPGGPRGGRSELPSATAHDLEPPTQ